MELVSIIIPIYNAEKTLNRCIESVINQTYNKLEIILVNDGSTDNSLDICKFYSKIDKRIKLYSDENKGVSTARNIGLKNTTGKYIMFIDSDDYIDNMLISNLIKKFNTENSDIIFTGFIKEYNGNKQIIKLFEETSSNIGDIVCKLFEYGVFGYTCNKIFRKDIIEKNDILFLQSEELYEDQYFFGEYIKHVNKISISSEYGYHYIWNKDSLSNKNRENLLELQDKMFNYLFEFSKHIHINEEKRIKLLYKYTLNNYYCYLKECSNVNTSSNKQIKLSSKFLKTNMYRYYCKYNKRYQMLNKKEYIITKILNTPNMKLKLQFIKFLRRFKVIK